MWTNEKINKYFELDDNDIKLIETTNVVGYNDQNFIYYLGNSEHVRLEQ